VAGQRSLTGRKPLPCTLIPNPCRTWRTTSPKSSNNNRDQRSQPARRELSELEQSFRTAWAIARTAQFGGGWQGVGFPVYFTRSRTSGRTRQRIAGAKAPTSFSQVAARLKPCPDTKQMRALVRNKWPIRSKCVADAKQNVTWFDGDSGGRSRRRSRCWLPGLFHLLEYFRPHEIEDRQGLKPHVFLAGCGTAEAAP